MYNGGGGGVQAGVQEAASGRDAGDGKGGTGVDQAAVRHLADRGEWRALHWYCSRWSGQVTVSDVARRYRRRWSVGKQCRGWR